MHHIVVAGFIVYALMAEVLRRLAEQPELRARCAAEIDEFLPGDLSVAGLSSLHTAGRVVMEAKTVGAPGAPGLRSGEAHVRVRRLLGAGGLDGLPGPAPQQPRLVLYTHPDVFDPNRFGSGRTEHERHPLAFISQGADPPASHRCLGLDYSTYLVLAFLTVAVRGYEWELPPQDLRYDWRMLPPEPADGLRIRMRPLRSEPPAGGTIHRT